MRLSIGLDHTHTLRAREGDERAKKHAHRQQTSRKLQTEEGEGKEGLSPRLASPRT